MHTAPPACEAGETACFPEVILFKILEIEGLDASDFLHRVTAGTVKGVATGEGRAGLLLTGQSQLLAQFDLLRRGETRYWLVSPEACAEALASGLEALHFSERLELRPLPGVKAGIREKAEATRPEQGVFSWELAGEELRWPAPVPGYEISTAAEGAPSGWNWDRIQALVPWPPSDWSSSIKALEAGVLPWIDRHKGCYPGQEVVELSLNVGHPARVLVAVAAPTPLPEGALPWGEGAPALVTSVAARDGEARALVRVPWAKKDYLPPGFRRLRSHW